jgi:hypothetical protein
MKLEDADADPNIVARNRARWSDHNIWEAPPAAEGAAVIQDMSEVIGTMLAFGIQ